MNIKKLIIVTLLMMMTLAGCESQEKAVNGQPQIGDELEVSDESQVSEQPQASGTMADIEIDENLVALTSILLDDEHIIYLILPDDKQESDGDNLNDLETKFINQYDMLEGIEKFNAVLLRTMSTLTYKALNALSQTQINYLAYEMIEYLAANDYISDSFRGLYFEQLTNADIMIQKENSDSGNQPKEELDIDFVESVEIEVVDEHSIRLHNTSDETINIVRNFLMKEEILVTLAPSESYIDDNLYDGTTYTYYGQIGKGVMQNSLEVTTIISETTLRRGLFYDWESVVKEQMESEADEIIALCKDPAVKYSKYLHGVKFEVIYDTNTAEVFSEEQLIEFYEYSAKYFHRQWLLYEGFPLDEYKIIFKNGEKDTGTGANVWGYRMIHVGQENLSDIECHFKELGVAAHEIGHAWCGDMMFNLKTPEGDGWYIEGVNVFNEYLVMGSDYVAPSIGLTTDKPAERLSAMQYGHEYEDYKTEPLAIMMGKYHGSNVAPHYIKGALFTYLVYERLNQNGLEYEDYLKFTYDNYFLSKVQQYDPNHTGFFNLKHNYGMDSHDFQESLEEFSGLKFDDLFNSYVFGEEEMELNIDENLFIEWDY